MNLQEESSNKFEMIKFIQIWSCAVLYLFAHADLHDSIVNECFPEIFVFQLLKALHVHPCFFNMLAAVKQIRKAQTQYYI